MWIKGIDELPNWLVEIAAECGPLELGLVAEMTQKWSNSNNEIFSFSLLSEEAFAFQGTERVKWIKVIPEFMESITNDLTINIVC